MNKLLFAVLKPYEPRRKYKYSTFRFPGTIRACNTRHNNTLTSVSFVSKLSINKNYCDR